jgi:hypothetical protein
VANSSPSTAWHPDPIAGVPVGHSNRGGALTAVRIPRMEASAMLLEIPTKIMVIVAMKCVRVDMFMWKLIEVEIEQLLQ